MTVRELVTVLGFKLDDAPVKKYDKQIDSTKAKTDKLAAATKGIGMAWKIAAAAAAVGVAWISKNIIDATVEMENYRTQMEAFTGSADSAAAALAELRDKSSDALFGTGTLVSSYKQLRMVGMGAEDTSRMIDVLGDCANGSAENFSALSGVLTKVATTGKVNEGTLRQLAGAGFGVQDMAQGLGMSVDQLNDQIAAGKIGFNELSKAMEGATQEGGRFYGNLDRQSRTLGGSIKILKSTISDIGDAIGTAVIPQLVTMIRHFTNLIKIGKDGLVGFGIKAFQALIGMIQDVIIFFQLLQMRMKRFGGAFTPIKAIISDVFGFLKSVIQSAYPFLMNLAQLFLVAFKPIQAFVRPVLEALKPIIKNVFGFLSRIIGGLIPIVNGLTPVFGRLGKIVGGLLGPILGIAVAIKGVNTAIAIGKGAIAGVKAIQTAYGLLTGTMSVMKAAAEGNRLAMLMLDAQMIKSKAITLAKAAAEKIAALATKIWSGIQLVFNAIMSANPIALIIIGVAALIAAIILLVKNWDKVSAALKKAFEAIGNFFKKIWDGIKSFFSKIVDFVKKNFLNIINVILAIMFLPAAIVMAVVRLIIKHWDTIKAALVKVFTFVADKAKAIWEAIVNVVKVIVDKIKQIWGAITGFFGKLWGGVKNVASKALDGIKNVAGKAWDGIKDVAGKTWENMKNGAAAAKDFFKDRWNDIKDAGAKAFNFLDNISGGALSRMRDGFLNTINNIKDFFSGLWAALKEGPTATFEYIKNAFFGLFDGIKEKFLGFINVIKDGWDKVKGFFGGIKDAVVNVVTGGGDKGAAAKPVNDMIVTPEGNYSTHPDDYIMAMKNPLDILDSLFQFLSGGQLQPAYAGTPQAAVAGAVGQTSNYSTVNYGGASSSTMNAKTTITVNVPPGTPQEQSEAIARQIDAQFNERLAGSINSSRANIPSPEVRRN